MEVSPRIAEQIAKLPAEMKQVFDAEMAAGNAVKFFHLNHKPE